jgi:hypothetical protein
MFRNFTVHWIDDELREINVLNAVILTPVEVTENVYVAHLLSAQLR